MVKGEAELFNVERDGTVNISNRDRNQFKFHIHR
jgi:hypothetical protein